MKKYVFENDSVLSINVQEHEYLPTIISFSAPLEENIENDIDTIKDLDMNSKYSSIHLFLYKYMENTNYGCKLKV